MNSLAHWEGEFARVGWFIPPYAQMGFLSEIAGKIHHRASSFSQDELEVCLEPLYNSRSLAAMVCSRYPVAPVISDYKKTISESVEAHFLGLHHVAVAGLIPVIEGAGRALLQQRGLRAKSVQAVFITLAKDCKRESKEKCIGSYGEVASMMDSFSQFTSKLLYIDDFKYPLPDKTNRPGITHGSYQDGDYGSRLNFYKTISAVDFLTFISSFRASISWFAPDYSPESERLASYYRHLQVLRVMRDYPAT